MIAGLPLTSAGLERPSVKDAGAMRLCDVIFAPVKYIKSFEKSLKLVGAY